MYVQQVQVRSEDSASPFRELCISLDSPGPSLLSHHVKAYTVTLVKMEQMECSAVRVGVCQAIITKNMTT